MSSRVHRRRGAAAAALMATLCAGNGAAAAALMAALCADTGAAALLTVLAATPYSRAVAADTPASDPGTAPSRPSSQWAPRSGVPYNGPSSNGSSYNGDSADTPADSAPHEATPSGPPGSINPSFPAGLPLGAGPRGPMRPPEPAKPGTGSGTGAAAPGSDEDIRDIRGPIYIMPVWLIPALIAGALLLALTGYAIWRWLRRRRAARALLPFELALQRLEHIRPLMQPQNAREFSIAVSDIVRGYIEQRFDVIATHRTTEEFLRDLLETTNAALAKHRGLLSEFLQQCDLVKFGGMSLTLQNMESLHRSARDFVLETAKPEEPAPRDGVVADGTATTRKRTRAGVSPADATALRSDAPPPPASGEAATSSGALTASAANTSAAIAFAPDANTLGPSVPDGRAGSAASDSARFEPAKSATARYERNA